MVSYGGVSDGEVHCTLILGVGKVRGGWEGVWGGEGGVGRMAGERGVGRDGGYGRDGGCGRDGV